MFELDPKVRPLKSQTKLAPEGAKPCAPGKAAHHPRLKKLLDQLATRRAILPKSNLGKAISYALNQWPNIQTYLAGGRVKIDSNLIGNASLTPGNWLAARISKAGRAAA